ncbi:hypothetical protein SDC9_78650 [bioreactor metagenome]|uniref:Uncharacterized protein n=1 Tax=bioreactor metagenome TaxID=1076179 RepID=A0A644YW64_9ZZZZ
MPSGVAPLQADGAGSRAPDTAEAGRGPEGPAKGSALVHRDHVTPVVADVDLARTRDPGLGVGIVLTPLGDPAGQPADGEQHGEHLHREAHRLVDQAGVEVDVRVELARDEVVVGQRGLLELLGDGEQFLVAVRGGVGDLVGVALDDRGAGVEVLVDAVAEAHQLDAGLLGLDLLEVVLGGDALVPDRREHLQHGLVGAAVQRAGQGVHAGGDRDVEVGLRGADQPDGRGGAVLLVVGVQHEQGVQALGDDVLELVLLGRGAEGHPDEVLHVGQPVLRVHEGLALRVLVRVRGQRGDLGEELAGGDLHVLGVETDMPAVEGRQRADAGRQHRHRVRLAREATEQVAHPLVQEHVVDQLVLELLHLLLGGQLAVEDQPHHLDEGALLRELLDRVAAVPQDALFAVDEGDLRPARGGVAEGLVQGDVPGLGAQLADVVPVVAVDGLDERKLDLLAVTRGENWCGHPLLPCSHCCPTVDPNKKVRTSWVDRRAAFEPA